MKDAQEIMRELDRRWKRHREAVAPLLNDQTQPRDRAELGLSTFALAAVISSLRDALGVEAPTLTDEELLEMDAKAW